ncbi:phage tail protein [Ligilactobacillus acidipiscis]|nr:phage tail protein [Ligilactobacillus acidipiscis]
MITVEITADETFNKFKKHKFGYLGGRDFAISDDGTNWEVINHYPDLSLTDPNTALIGDYYYIASDNGIWKTKDFNTFTKINAAIADSKHADLHSFEWFQDLNGSWFVKYNATAPNDGIYTYWADFDETTDSFVDTVDQFNLPLGDTSGLAYVRGNYYIWMAGDKLYKAADFKGQFKEVATDISGSTAHQLFSSVVSDNYLYVYFIDRNKTYMRSSKTTNLIHWTNPVEVADVGLGSYFFNANAVTIYPSYKRERTFDKVLKVTANGFKQTVPISCMVFSSLQVQWEQNGTWQIDFTAYDDDSVSYAMLSEEAEIVFNGQAFIVKQAVQDAGGGIDTKQITASHVYNEINRVRQRKTKTGTLTYTVNDVLSFYLDDKTANPLGFTYHVYGNFDKQQIENLGNSSGSDMISKVLDQWPKAIVYPDNKEIKVYTPEVFEKDYGGRIDYLNNSSDVKMTVDSTGITNQVKVFGKQVENTSDNATDDSKVKYYFEPFIVEDKASIRQYKLHPMDDISDERFTNKDAMQKYAQGQLSPNPAISIEITMEDNEMPIAGEKRHLIAKPLKLETDLAVIGYTWHPFDSSQKNSLSFANLPASILQTQASINSQIRKVQLIAQQAINSAKTGTRNYVSDTDPMQNDNNDVRAGDIWTLPLLSTETQGLLKSVDAQDDSSANNQTIYTDPDSLSKIDVQLSIWNGSRWLEISNQRTINTINDNQHKVADQVAEQQEGIAKAVQDAQTAVTNADKAIEQAGFANAAATTAKEVANNLKEDVAGAKSDSATALQQAKDAMTKAQQAIADVTSGKTDISEIQTTIESISTNLDNVSKGLDTAKSNISGLSSDLNTAKNNLTSVSKNLDSTKNDLATVSKQAKDNGTNITNITKDIDGVKADLADTNGNVSQVVATAKELSSAMTNAKGDISNLQQTAKGLTSSIKDNKDNISNLQQTATQLSSSMTDAKNNISNLQQTAKDLQSSIKDNIDNISSVKQTAKELSTAITNAQGDISTLQQTATQLSSSIKDNKDNISSVKQTATQLSSDMKDAQGNISSLQQSATSLSSTIGTIQKDLSDTKKTISTQGTQITQNAKDITSKANSADLDATNKRMTTAETSIKQNAKDIESKASQSDVNTLTGRVKTAESNISQNANSIKSKVSSSDVQDILDKGKYATQTWTGSQIDQKANEISSTVSEVSNKVDGLDVNSRNLAVWEKWQRWGTDLASQTYVSTTTQSIELACDNTNNYQGIRFMVDLKPATKYVMSFDATLKKGVLQGIGGHTGAFSSAIVYIDGKKTDSIWSNGTNTLYKVGDKHHYEVHLISKDDPNNSANTPGFFLQPNRGNDSKNDQVTVLFENIMIQEGDKATGYTPAPEDLATVTALSKVDQKADSISTTVTNNKKDADSKFTTVNQTISGIQSTVKNKADSSTVTQLDKVVQSKVDSSTYNSKVTQLANDINLRVQSKDLLSQINIQAGSTLIQSNKLYLDSSSVVFSGKAFIPSASIASVSADKIDTSKFSIGSGKYSIDMTGNDGIDIGSDSKQWSVSINSGTLLFAGSDNKQLEWVGGLDYTVDTKNSNTNGFGAYVYTKQRLGAPYGGDYFAIGEAVQKKGDATVLSQDVIYAPNEHSGYIPGITFNKHVFVNADSQLVFTSGATNTQPKLVFSGFNDTNAGIYMDTYGNVVGNTSAQTWNVKDKNLNPVFSVDLNGNGKVWLAGASIDGGSLYAANNNGWYIRNHDGSYGDVNAKSFIQKSSIDLKKNIEMADTEKLANDVYNMDVTTWNYKEETSQNSKHIGAVIGGDYHINSCLLSDDKTGVNTTSLTFALVATVQKQASQISELIAELTALKIKEQKNG